MQARRGLAYVAVHLLDTQVATVAAWIGDDGGVPPEAAAGRVRGRACRRRTSRRCGVRPVLDAAALLAAAEELVPHPWGWDEA